MKNLNESPKITYKENRFDVIKRKKILKLLLKTIIKEKQNIINVNINEYGIIESETLFFEIMPIITNLKINIKNLEEWTQLVESNNVYEFGNKSYSLYVSKGIIGVFIECQLPFYYIITTLISIISAGNKCTLHLINYPYNVIKAIENILNPIFENSEIIIISDFNEINESIELNKFDAYFVCGPNLLKEKIKIHAIDDNIQINYYITENYKNCFVIDKSSKIIKYIDRLLLQSFIQSGRLFFKNYIYFIHIDQIEKIKLEIIKIKTKIKNENNYFLKDQYYIKNKIELNEAINYINYLQNEPLVETIMGGNYNEETNYIEPTIFYTYNLTPEIIKKTNAPIAIFISFKNIDEVTKYLQQLGEFNKINFYSKSKENLDILLTYSNTELFLVNENFMDRYNFTNFHVENKTYYKGYSGFTNFSKIKTICIKNKTSIFEKLLFNNLNALQRKWFDFSFFKNF